VEPFDPTRPNIARVWDYWLGGKDNFAVDRELAQKMLEVHPPRRSASTPGTRSWASSTAWNSCPPAFVSVRGWHGGHPASVLKPRTAAFVGGVARKP